MVGVLEPLAGVRGEESPCGPLFGMTTLGDVDCDESLVWPDSVSSNLRSLLRSFFERPSGGWSK